MKAYKLAQPRRIGPRIDLGPDISLPQVFCDTCGRTWGNGCREYPSLDFSFFAEPVFKYENIIDLATFKKLCQRIQTAYGRDILLLPGCSVGPLTGTGITTKLWDFEWGYSVCPQISKRAEAMLRERGLNLTTGECKITIRKKLFSGYLALQPEPTLLVSDENLKANKKYFCRACNYYYRDHLIKRPPSYQFIHSKWPKSHPLVRAVETSDVLASPEFMEAVTALKLTGLEFVECGEFV